ncbi:MULTISPECIES: hypothetical protein [Bradyrhizobium]|jgi:phosphoglycerate dehydrogenase-like enzyme|uniref:hypothetical protein n=1 Tax=Bradyrhizobium elkanii TaxID=29448 RepID=UPI000483280B|nr:hypothetical protein [Bradyrhizobium elkanii]
MIPAAGFFLPLLFLVRPGLTVTSSSASAPAMAEYGTIHTLSHLHPIAEQAAHQQAHQWERRDFAKSRRRVG